MNAIWLLWTKPLETGRGLPWLSEKHHLLAWILSVETARKHYPHTFLYTDNKGAEMLVDGLGPEFKHVSSALNALHDHNPEWWAFGKIYTYVQQSEPFVHIDNDVFLWNRLPIRLETAELFAQNPEYFIQHFGYHTENFRSVVHTVNGWLPYELEYYILQDSNAQHAACCGIFGGNRIEFIRYYASLAIKLMEHSRNQAAWRLLDNKLGISIIFEQYLLTACIDYYQNQYDSPYHDIDIRYLFRSFNDAYSNAARNGYTHLSTDGPKKSPIVVDRLEQRVQRDYPEYYERCIQYLKKQEGISRKHQ